MWVSDRLRHNEQDEKRREKIIWNRLMQISRSFHHVEIPVFSRAALYRQPDDIKIRHDF